MQDAALVRVVDGPGHDRDQPGSPLGVGRQVVGPFGQAAALDQFQAEVQPALVLPHFVNGHDVRVIQIGGQFGLVAKAADLGGRPPGPDHLEGDEAVEALLAGPVHHSHPTLADHAQQFVVAERAQLRRRQGALVRPGGCLVSSPSRCRGPNRLAQRDGDPVHFLQTGQELGQLGGKLRVAGQQLLPIRGPARVPLLEVGGRDLSEPQLAFGQATAFDLHRSPLLLGPE